ncbi:hypothetical protein T10_8248 [Trichinella papuae]|uniref:Uncharacterized protein n=1 Tax=Trichinella papuae TaxID=268474 RepID=A0A0V1N924_9BILA|nr:hypothetical protein T10_8248 [Trichinella papuae]
MPIWYNTNYFYSKLLTNTIKASKITPDTLADWSAFVQYKKDDEITLTALFFFLFNQTCIKGPVTSAHTRPTLRKYDRKSEKREHTGKRFMTATVREDPEKNNVMCAGSHSIEKCLRFSSYSLTERWQSSCCLLGEEASRRKLSGEECEAGS